MATRITSMVDGFDELNEPVKLWTDAVFGRICQEEDLLWRFMNTLSYMEHIGSYKIMATQRSGAMDYATLKHLNEETGHAVFFKRHAERLTGDSVDYSPLQLLAPASARAYFGRLEAVMVRRFGERATYRTVYLYMSLIVEFRAVWGYQILQRVMNQRNLDVSLDKLLAEEQGHLYSMARRLESDGDLTVDDVRHFCLQEKRIYERLLSSIDSCIDQELLKVA